MNNQLSVFESEKNLPTNTKIAIAKTAKKLAEYYKSLSVLAAINRDPYLPDPYEEQNLRDYAEAMNNLTSRLKLNAMFLGIGEYRDLHLGNK